LRPACYAYTRRRKWPSEGDCSPSSGSRQHFWPKAPVVRTAIDPERKGSETPANKIATAQATLELALRINAEVNAGQLIQEIYKQDVSIITGGQGLRLPPFPEGTKENLADGTFKSNSDFASAHLRSRPTKR
jgi:hypothetical protein